MKLAVLLLAMQGLGSTDYKTRVWSYKTLNNIYSLPIHFICKSSNDFEIQERAKDLYYKNLNKLNRSKELFIYKYFRYTYYDLYFGCNYYIDDYQLLKDMEGAPWYREYIAEQLLIPNKICDTKPGFLIGNVLYYDVINYQNIKGDYVNAKKARNSNSLKFK